jgi:TonB family protein
MPFTYHQSVRVRADASGVTIVQSLPFRSFAPTMHLRWSDLVSCNEQHWPGRTDAVLRARDSNVEISVHDGEQLLRHCRQNPVLAAPQVASSSPIRIKNERRREIMSVGGDVTAPTVLRRQQPAYEACNLKRIRISGPLVAEAIIDSTGNVREVRIVKAVHPCLDRAFEASLEQWKFRPAQHRGLPVAVRMHFTANINVR